MNMSKIIRALVVMSIITASILLAGMCGGCQPGTKTKYIGKLDSNMKLKAETRPDGTGTIEVEFTGAKSTDQKHDAILPPNIQNIPAVTVNDAGINTEGGTSYQPPEVSAIKANTKWIIGVAIGFLVAAAALGVGSLMSIWWLKFTGSGGVAIACAVVSGILFIFPTYIETMGRPTAIALFCCLIAAIVAGVVWVFAMMRSKGWFKKRADSASAQLMAESSEASKRGDNVKAKDLANSAVAARRTADPQYDETFKNAKKDLNAPTPPPADIEPPSPPTQ